MARRSLHKLSTLFVRKVSEAGAYEDGGGLRLIVDSPDDCGAPGSKRWVLRITIAGKRVSRGLGGFPNVSLESARATAAKARQDARQGIDHVGDAKRLRQNTDHRMSFRDAFAKVLELKEKQLSNSKALAQWESTMDAYVFPTIGNRPVADLKPPEIIAVLEPIWVSKAETAKRILQRINAVFEYAIVTENRLNANPCAGIASILGTAHREVVNHRSLNWQQVPKFVKALSAKQSASRLCLRWTILTASRSIEARGAAWSEIDRSAKVWTVPADRMKRRKAHRVPLSRACLDLLMELEKLSLGGELLFPSPNAANALSDAALALPIRSLGYSDRTTVHGFRSAFKEWATAHAVDDDLSEAALAHADKNRVRAAYLRSDRMEDRRKIMNEWGRFVTSSLSNKN